ncbi:MAG: asparagine synthase (glutamine-hydrolyzing) [Actinomycetota bacterium]|nr:asparagine synthase (glutamine-hydrolyzing) [Actinomycetota bacterium]
MCGIAGAFWSHAHDVDGIQEGLTRAVAAMHHRGPDSAGQVLWGPEGGSGAVAILGSTRLAVLDRSAAGRQPMSTEDGRFTVVYNGEITNYLEIRTRLAATGSRFSSGSDTEVLLQAWSQWGLESLRHLEGMYAFAVIDRVEATLTVCRDPFGIKPLYYRHFPDEGFVFGSEISSILPLLPGALRLNWRVAGRFLSSGYCDDSPETFIDGINQLMPGDVIRVHLRTSLVERLAQAWRPGIGTDEALSHRDAVDGVRSLFLASVERNLRADAPLGIALSGGIDSSSIACAVRAVAPDHPLNLYSYQSSDSRTDESRWAGLVAQQLGATVHTVCPTPNDLATDMDDLILTQGEPFGSTSIYAQYRLFRLMHEHGMVVSLDGQGGDEVFAGYHGFAGQRLRSLAETGDVVGAARFSAAWGRWPGRSVPKAWALAGAEIAPLWAVSAGARVLPGYALPGVRMPVLRERGLAWGWLPDRASNDGLRGVRVKAELRAALTERGLQVLLRHGDRNSMRFSVESRVPFLDRSLVEFVLSFPEHWLVDEAGTSKAVLRHAMRGLVPDAVLDRRDKIGFAGDASWVDAQRGVLAEQIAAAPDIGFLDKRALLRGAFGPAVNRVAPDQLWRVFNLYRWADLLGVDCT